MFIFYYPFNISFIGIDIMSILFTNISIAYFEKSKYMEFHKSQKD
jgi:hypothetical protein